MNKISIASAGSAHATSAFENCVIVRATADARNPQISTERSLHRLHRYNCLEKSWGEERRADVNTLHKECVRELSDCLPALIQSLSLRSDSGCLSVRRRNSVDRHSESALLCSASLARTKLGQMRSNS
jgi:hypothetical protein